MKQECNPGGSGGAQVLLWENPNIDDDFAAQTINITNMLDYDRIDIWYTPNYYAHNYQLASFFPSLLPSGEVEIDLTFFRLSGSYNNAMMPWRRVFPNKTNKTIRFDTGRLLQAGSSSSPTNNSLEKPYRIYGVNV